MTDKPSVYNTGFIDVWSKNRRIEEIIPVVDVLTEFHEEDVHIKLPIKFSTKLPQKCALCISYTDDPTPKRANGWVSLGYNRFRMQLICHEVIQNKAGTIFIGRWLHDTKKKYEEGLVIGRIFGERPVCPR